MKATQDKPDCTLASNQYVIVLYFSEAPSVPKLHVSEHLGHLDFLGESTDFSFHRNWRPHISIFELFI